MVNSLFKYRNFKWLKRLKRRRRSKLLRIHAYAIWIVRIVILLIVLDIFYLIHIWPDWDKLDQGPIRKTAFMTTYEVQQQKDPQLPQLHWTPVPLTQIPRHVRRAIIVAEDARFYEHKGFDLIAFKEAMDYNLGSGELKYGASTISQQTIKNMFLSQSRNPLRKWHEIVLTLGMELSISKSRILEIYMNVAEFGIGVYGVEAAARAYWGGSISALTPYQAAQMAATLPSPKKHNPDTQTRRFKRRTRKIYGFMKRSF